MKYAREREEATKLFAQGWGNVRAVSRYPLCNICTVAPDAHLRGRRDGGRPRAAARGARVAAAPELIPELLMPPADFNELTLAGELALCAQRMAKGRRP